MSIVVLKIYRQSLATVSSHQNLLVTVRKAGGLGSVRSPGHFRAAQGID